MINRFFGYEWFISLRYLRAKRKQTFISVISFISIAGVTLGVAALIVVLALWFVSRILDSPFGAVIETIRENEKRAAACGYDVARSKWLAFVLSAGICGLAGTLRA